MLPTEGRISILQRKNHRKQSLILIGMPGCGKSTVGKVLAQNMGVSFLDTDMMIQRRERLPLQRIIAKKGGAHFAVTEESVLTSLRQRGQVIATGGSAVFYPKGMENLKRLGTVVYIRISYRELEKRLWNVKTRGIVFEPGQDLMGLYEQRKPLYEKYADIVVDSFPGSAKDVAGRILALLQESGRGLFSVETAPGEGDNQAASASTRAKKKRRTNKSSAVKKNPQPDGLRMRGEIILSDNKGNGGVSDGEFTEKPSGSRKGRPGQRRSGKRADKKSIVVVSESQKQVLYSEEKEVNSRDKGNRHRRYNRVHQKKDTRSQSEQIQ